MYCSICHRYSANPREVNSKVFNINGYQRKFSVCIDEPHTEEQRILTDLVNVQEREQKQREDATKEQARKLLEQEAKRQKEHEEQVKKAIQEKAYRDTINNFNRLFPSVEARKEIVRLLQEASESKE